MISGLRLVTRIGLFSALVYVLSWATVYLPNVSLIFFIVYSAGLLWGFRAGLLVGLIGMGLWTSFNPYGPAHLYIMAAQMIGAAGSGLLGGWQSRSFRSSPGFSIGKFKLALSGMVCALLYFLPVSLVDAWLFGPFRVRLITSIPWVALSVGANMIIFPSLFAVTRRLASHEEGSL